MDLFEHKENKVSDTSIPLAEKMRPENLKEFVGQTHIVGKGTILSSAIENDQIFSMILWGPPGCGKTTLANIIANETRSNFIQISAVLSGVKDIRSAIADAKKQKNILKKRTILFVDEVHRFNKAQQDAFLKHVETGLITLIGATTENPSFEVIPALMSRCRVVTLNALSPEDMMLILERAITDKKKGLGNSGFILSTDALSHLAAIGDGDVRTALNGLEIAVSFVMAKQKPSDRKKTDTIQLEDVENALQKKALLYDKSGEEHYNLISAFHKSLRGSDPDAAIYWLERMLLGGEDPFFIARRMVRFATEDIGNADPYALQIALIAMEAFRFLGHPEGELALAQAAAYLATAPKSNSIYKAVGRIRAVVEDSGAFPVPMHIRNAPTRLMKSLGYGKDYKYAHDYKEAYVSQGYLPQQLDGVFFYHPSERGYEKTIKQRLDKWREFKKRGCLRDKKK